METMARCDRRRGGPGAAAPAPRRPVRRDGFSLIEVTIAIVILAVLSFTTALALVPVSREHRAARETDIANSAVRSILEEIHATPFNEILGRYPDGEVIGIAALENGEIRVSYENPGSNPLILRLDLSWESPEMGPTQRSFFTVRTE
jgi:prepilin-type N-terminal cleavage/methylation domain-containing protein